MKYRRLAPEELKELEKEFVSFLASAQITAQDWEKMKKNEKVKAEELIAVFSDVVYDKVLGKVQYLEFRDSKTLNLFHCDKDVIRLVGFRVKPGSKLDLTKEDIAANWDDNKIALEFVHSEKKYKSERGLEVLELLESGCLISDGKLFGLLSSLKG